VRWSLRCAESEDKSRRCPKRRDPLSRGASALVQNLPVVSTGLGEFAPARVLALSDILARILGAGKVPASNLCISAIRRLRYGSRREAAANILQYCARPLQRALWAAGTPLGSAALSGMGLDHRVDGGRFSHIHRLHRVVALGSTSPGPTAWLKHGTAEALCRNLRSRSLPRIPIAALRPTGMAVIKKPGIGAPQLIRFDRFAGDVIGRRCKLCARVSAASHHPGLWSLQSRPAAILAQADHGHDRDSYNAPAANTGRDG